MDALHFFEKRNLTKLETLGHDLTELTDLTD